MPHKKSVWLLRYVDRDGPGEWVVYLHKNPAIREAAAWIHDLLPQVQDEWPDDDEILETVDELREDYEAGKFEDVISGWEHASRDHDLKDWVGTVEFTTGILIESPKDWTPEKPA